MSALGDTKAFILFFLLPNAMDVQKWLSSN
jgi:hypothetical protein